MNTVQDYLNYLYTLGFSKDKQYYNYLDLDLTSVDIHNPNTGECVGLYCESTSEWYEYIQSLEKGTEVFYDLTQHVVNAVYVEGELCTERSFSSGENNGIYLVSYPDSYHSHKLTDESFKKAVWTQSHTSQHMIDIIKCHLHNLELLNKILFPILNKYEFYESYNSLVHCFEIEERKEDSNITSNFRHPNMHVWDEIIIETDVFDGSLYIEYFEDIDFKSVTQEELEKEFIKRILSNKNGDIDIKYSYMFNDDPKDNIYTYNELMNYMQKLRYNESLDDINWDNIPDKYIKQHETNNNN